MAALGLQVADDVQFLLRRHSAEDAVIPDELARVDRQAELIARDDRFARKRKLQMPDGGVNGFRVVAGEDLEADPLRRQRFQHGPRIRAQLVAECYQGERLEREPLQRAVERRGTGCFGEYQQAQARRQ